MNIRKLNEIREVRNLSCVSIAELLSTLCP